MGTRADFYIGIDRNATWLGSISWDGYPEGIGSPLDSESEEDFLKELETFFEGRDDVSTPEHGWPWPWPDSSITDYAYAYHDGCVWVTQWDDHRKTGRWLRVSEMDEFEELRSYHEKLLDEYPDNPEPMPPEGVPLDFPDMTEVQNVTLGVRSGLAVYRG